MVQYYRQIIGFKGSGFNVEGFGFQVPAVRLRAKSLGLRFAL